jgi:hypothetical protein
MYTGTLITELMATVERAERNLRLKQYLDQVQLEQLFELQGADIENELVLAGAA